MSAAKPEVSLIGATPAAGAEGSFVADTAREDADIAQASLARVKDLERLLLRYLQEHPSPTNRDLAKQLNDDIKTIQEADIDQASKLQDLHAKTKDFFTKKLAADSTASQAEKTEIMRQLDALHTMRQDLLQKYLRKEADAGMETAYRQLLDLAGLKDENPPAFDPSKEPESRFLNFMQTNPTLTLKDGSTIHYDGTTLTASTPEALALAMLASGKKGWTLSGGPMVQLATMRAVVNNCLANNIPIPDIQLDENKIQYAGAYLSRAEFVNAQKEFDALKKIMSANKMARANKKNHVFNGNGEQSPETKAQDLANTFSTLAPEHHQRFVNKLRPDQIVDLRFQLRNAKFGQQSGSDYVNSLWSSRNFIAKQDSEYKKAKKYIHQQLSNKVFAADEAPYIDSLAKNKDWETIAGHAAEYPNMQMRSNMYKKIGELKFFDRDEVNADAKNIEYRARTKARILCTHLAETVKHNNTSKPDFRPLNPEALAIIHTSTPEEAGITPEEAGLIRQFLNENIQNMEDPSNIKDKRLWQANKTILDDILSRKAATLAPEPEDDALSDADSLAEADSLSEADGLAAEAAARDSFRRPTYSDEKPSDEHEMQDFNDEPESESEDENEFPRFPM